MAVLSNPCGGRLQLYLILLVLTGIPRHVVLSTSWHTMGEMQSKLSLHLTRGHSGNTMLERISSLSSSPSGSSHHSIWCVDVTRRKRTRKNDLCNVIIHSCTSSPLPPQSYTAKHPQLPIQGNVLFAFQGKELFQ